MQYEQSGALPISKMALVPQYDDESDEAANGDDTTDGDDVVGDIADVCDVNGDEDDDELRNFSACIRDDLGPTQDNITSGPSHVRHLCCLNNEKTYAGQKSLHREILTE